jgi:hypothetical protein
MIIFYQGLTTSLFCQAYIRPDVHMALLRHLQGCDTMQFGIQMGRPATSTYKLDTAFETSVPAYETT